MTDIPATVPIGRAPLDPRLPRIHNGITTVSHPAHGHYTIQVKSVLHGKFAGKRIVSLLTGPDNTKDYTGIAFLDESKVDPVCNVFRKYRTIIQPQGEGHMQEIAPQPTSLTWNKRWGKIEKKCAVWLNLVCQGERGYWAQEGYKVQSASICVFCNRPLTDAISIEAGAGPECRQKHGIVI